MQPAQDTAVEIETRAYDEIIDLLTPKNGKLEGILGELPVPYSLKVKRLSFNEDRLKSLPWDSIAMSERKNLLHYVSRKKETSFFDNRQVPGMTIKPLARLKFDSPTIFLGTLYEAGSHDIDVSKAMGKVEYVGPENNPDYFELHFRTNQSSGATSRDAWKFLTGLGLPKTHQHVHIVSQLPLQELRENPELEGLRLGDYFRRANLVAEMLTIVDERGAIRANKSPSVTYFDHMSKPMLHGVTEYFVDVGRNQSKVIGDDFKMGWIGFRGADTYDSSNLFGFEYRAIPRNGNESTYEEILDTIQHSLHTKDYGIKRSDMQAWLTLQGGKEAKDAMAETWYDRSPNLVVGAHPGVRKVLDISSPLLIEARARDNREVYMLVHNWSNDPLFYDKPLMQKKIVEAQIRALERLPDALGGINKIMKDFLKDSGLFEAFSKSLGTQSN